MLGLPSLFDMATLYPNPYLVEQVVLLSDIEVASRPLCLSSSSLSDITVRLRILSLRKSSHVTLLISVLRLFPFTQIQPISVVLNLATPQNHLGRL